MSEEMREEQRSKGKRSSMIGTACSLKVLGLLEAGFLDLVEQGLVAHAEQLRRLAAVPVDLPQRVGDDGALGR